MNRSSKEQHLSEIKSLFNIKHYCSKVWGK